MVPTGEVTYYLTDQVDSVRLVADEQGKPVTRTEYYSYGEVWFQEGLFSSLLQKYLTRQYINRTLHNNFTLQDHV